MSTTDTTGRIVRNTGAHYVVETPEGREINCKVKGNFRIKGLRTTNPVAVGDFVHVAPPGPDGTAYITDIADRRNYIVRRSINLSKQSHIIAATVDRARRPRAGRRRGPSLPHHRLRRGVHLGPHRRGHGRAAGGARRQGEPAQRQLRRGQEHHSQRPHPRHRPAHRRNIGRARPGHAHHHFLPPRGVAHYFPEMFAESANCRFNNCTHVHEPGCAVCRAIEEGRIAQSRYASYLSILDDSADDKYRKPY